MLFFHRLSGHRSGFRYLCIDSNRTGGWCIHADTLAHSFATTGVAGMSGMRFLSSMYSICWLILHFLQAVYFVNAGGLFLLAAIIEKHEVCIS